MGMARRKACPANDQVRGTLWTAKAQKCEREKAMDDNLMGKACQKGIVLNGQEMTHVARPVIVVTVHQRERNGMACQLK
jgi:hypothetical protein